MKSNSQFRGKKAETEKHTCHIPFTRIVFFFKLNPSAFLNLFFSLSSIFFLDYEAANQQRQVRTLSLIPFKFPILTWSPHTVAIRFSGAVKKQEVTFHGFEEYAGLDLGYSWLNTMAKQTTQRRRSQVKTEQIRSELLASLCIRALKFGLRLLSTERGESCSRPSAVFRIHRSFIIQISAGERTRGETLQALQTEMLRTAGRVKCDLV